MLNAIGCLPLPYYTYSFSERVHYRCQQIRAVFHNRRRLCLVGISAEGERHGSPVLKLQTVKSGSCVTEEACVADITHAPCMIQQLATIVRFLRFPGGHPENNYFYSGKK